MITLHAQSVQLSELDHKSDAIMLSTLDIVQIVEILSCDLLKFPIAQGANISLSAPYSVVIHDLCILAWKR
ncbi:hypothetical protein BALH_2825 [Bacillus thuringiensis str. Al Hakam]|nr:hypothetical protein BALH_2825 [Bacillus thuringiensis str. Al Hakam]